MKINLISTKNYILFITLFLLQLKSFAQIAIEWEKSYGGNNGDIAYSIALTDDGGYIIAGNTASTIGDVTVNNGFIDYWIIKVDSLGNKMWQKSLGGKAYDEAKCVIQNSNGEYIVAGHTKSTDGDVIGNHGENDYWILKLDRNGDIIWKKCFGSSGNDQVSSIVLTNDDGYVIAGSSVGQDGDVSGNHGYFDYWIVKIDSEGNIVWEKSLGGSGDDTAHTIIQSDDGGFIVAGSSASGDGQKTVKHGYYDFWIVKLDSSGEIIWEKSFGKTGYDFGESIIQTDDGNYYVTGRSKKQKNDLFYDYWVIKLSSNGNELWQKSVGGSGDDIPTSLANAGDGGVIVAGRTGSTDGDISYKRGSSDYWIAKLDANGNLIWDRSFGGNDAEDAFSLKQINNKNYVIAGYSRSDDGDATRNQGNADFWVVKFKTHNILGNVYFDVNQNGMRNDNEKGIDNIRLVINPGNIIVSTENGGKWSLDSLPAGQYSITIDTTGVWIPGDNPVQSLNITNSENFIKAPDFRMLNTNPCTQPFVSAHMPFMRRCFDEQKIYVYAENRNTATAVIKNAHVDVEIDPFVTVNTASLPYTITENNKCRFELGNLMPGQHVNFTISTTVSCETMLNQTLCIKATLNPVAECVLDTIPSSPVTIGSEYNFKLPEPCTLPWDGSSLIVDKWCVNDSVHFSITNTSEPGNGDMDCYSPVLIYKNDELITVDSVLLKGKEVKHYAFPSKGETWVLNVEQHPLHPGDSHPSAFIEACGSSLEEWIPRLVNNHQFDDGDPFVDIYCGDVRGSYDPNDKKGFPLGIGEEHFIQPNGQLQYFIRFQNTGTDTAFKVVIRDTLSSYLNIFSVNQGATSHPNNFKMYGSGILEWTFNNILLPDSTTDEAQSHGFVSFTVDQQPNLSNGTVITNSAAIYFDYNDPVITNQTNHTIDYRKSNVTSINDYFALTKEPVDVYPNPTSDFITVNMKELKGNKKYKLLDISGRIILEGVFTGINNQVNLQNIKSGIYFLNIKGYSPAKIIKL